MDFLGNPLGLVNDVTEGISGLINDGNLSGLFKNVTHGLSNTTAKVRNAYFFLQQLCLISLLHTVVRKSVSQSQRSTGIPVANDFIGKMPNCYEKGDNREEVYLIKGKTY